MPSKAQTPATEMPTKTIAFFNNKGGVGKTSLVYHLAWMFRELGHTVLAMDLEPLWPQGEHDHTILGSIDPLIQSLGDIKPLKPKQIAERLFLVPGDLGL